MTRTQSTLVWGLALIAGAAVLAWQQSITWALGAAGAVPTLAALVAFIAEEDANAKAKAAKQRAQSKPSAFLDQDKGDAF